MSVLIENGCDVKQYFLDSVRREQEDPRNSVTLDDQLDALYYFLDQKVKQFPIVTFVRPELPLKGCVVVKEFLVDGISRLNCFLRINMPSFVEGEEPFLCWSPWHPQQTKLKRKGFVSENDINSLFAWGNGMFDYLPHNGFNVASVHELNNGRQYLKERSDDDCGDDVCCFVTANNGSTMRECVFRSKNQQGRKSDRVVLKVLLPEGCFGMCGSSFQKRFTYEVPQIEENFFKRLCGALEDEGDFPVTSPVSEQSVWIKRNADVVKDLLKGGLLKSRKFGMSVAHNSWNDVQIFDKWCAQQTIYILKNQKV